MKPSQTLTQSRAIKALIAQMPQRPEIRVSQKRTCYSILEDLVRIKPKRCFTCIETYWFALLHELIHSTMHRKRLNRRFTDSGFIEEAVANTGAKLLCDSLKIRLPRKHRAILGYQGRVIRKRRLQEGILELANSAIEFILNGKPLKKP